MESAVAVPETRTELADFLDGLQPSNRFVRRPSSGRPRKYDFKREYERHIARQLRIRYDGYHCVLCGATESLTVHHIKPVRDGGRHVLINLVTLCRPCHDKVEQILNPELHAPRSGKQSPKTRKRRRKEMFQAADFECRPRREKCASCPHAICRNLNAIALRYFFALIDRSDTVHQQPPTSKTIK